MSETSLDTAAAGQTGAAMRETETCRGVSADLVAAPDFKSGRGV